MYQEIGLNLKVTGMGEVIQAFESIGRAINETQSKFTAVGQAFSGVGTVAKEQSSGIRTAIRGIGTEVAAVKGEIKGLQGAFNSLKMPAMGMGPGGGALPTGGGGRSSAWSAPMFLIRWWAMYKAAALVASGIKDVGFGAGRKDIAGAEAKLSSVGFDAAQKQMATIAANAFSRQFPNTTNLEYLGAMNQTASALDVNQVGMAKLDRITKAGIMGAKIAQMDSAKFSENVSKLDRMALMTESPETFETLQGGGQAHVKGYGLTNVAGMSEQNSALVARIVQKSNVWGQGIMDSLQYAGAPLMQQGVDLRGAIAMTAGMVDAGFKGAKSGRALKSIFSKAPEALGRLWMLSEGEAAQNTETGAVKFDPRTLRARSAMIRQKMSNMDEMSEFIPEIMGKASKFADTLSKNPAIGLSLISDLKMSQDFLPQLLTFLSPTYWAGMKDTVQDLKQNATLPYMINANKDMVQDTFQTWNGFTQSVQRFVEQVGFSITPLGASLKKATGWLDDKNAALAEENLGKTLFKEKSSQDIQDKTNAWMRTTYFNERDQAWAPTDKFDPKWTGEQYSEHWNTREEIRKRVWGDVWERGHSVYNRAMGLKPGDKELGPQPEEWGIRSPFTGIGAPSQGGALGLLQQTRDFLEPLMPKVTAEPTGARGLIGEFVQQLQGALDHLANEWRGKDAAGNPVQVPTINLTAQTFVDGSEIRSRTTVEQQQHYNSGSPLLMPSH